MTLTQTFIGSFIEMLTLCFIMNIFNDNYTSSKPRLLFACLVVGAITTATDIFFIPIGYIINYISLILLLSILMRVNLFSVFFEFLFSLASLAIFQIFLVFLTSPFIKTEELSFPIRLLHLVIILATCIYVGRNKKTHLRVRPFYQKYNEIIYLVAGNLFLFIIILVYLWDSNEKIFLQTVSVIVAFIILWCCINGYLLKKLVDGNKQKKLIEIHEQYIDMTENLLHGLYAEKHEFNRHLQTIEGMTHITEIPEDLVKNIQNYITSIEKERKINQTSVKPFNTGDSVINGLLYAKCNEAIQNDIHFFYVPSGKLPDFKCEKFELIEIMGNMIDNAFEYVKDLKPEERKVILKMQPQGGKNCIEVRNTFYQKQNEDLASMSKKGYSTKQGEKRGYGLYNVKRIAAKYDGTLNIYSQDTQLAVQVLL